MTRRLKKKKINDGLRSLCTMGSTRDINFSHLQQFMQTRTKGKHRVCVHHPGCAQQELSA